jgi:hypothetical protein
MRHLLVSGTAANDRLIEICQRISALPSLQPGRLRKPIHAVPPGNHQGKNLLADWGIPRYTSVPAEHNNRLRCARPPWSGNRVDEMRQAARAQ